MIMTFSKDGLFGDSIQIFLEDNRIFPKGVMRFLETDRPLDFLTLVATSDF